MKQHRAPLAAFVLVALVAGGVLAGSRSDAPSPSPASDGADDGRGGPPGRSTRGEAPSSGRTPTATVEPTDRARRPTAGGSPTAPPTAPGEDGPAVAGLGALLGTVPGAPSWDQPGAHPQGPDGQGGQHETHGPGLGPGATGSPSADPPSGPGAGTSPSAAPTSTSRPEPAPTSPGPQPTPGAAPLTPPP